MCKLGWGYAKTPSTQTPKIAYMISTLGVVMMTLGIYSVFGYLDPEEYSVFQGFSSCGGVRVLVQDLGFQISGLGVEVLGFGFRIQGSRFRVVNAL